MSPRGIDNHSTLRRAVLWLLGLTVLFILYASLYPFEFDPERLRALDRDALARALSWRRPPRSDLIANLIFYLPFGALATYLTPRRIGGARRCLAVLAAGAALSLGVECLQFTTRFRDPALSDVILNALSAALGAVAALTARRLGMRPSLPKLRTHRPDAFAVLLLALWVVFHAAPFMPSARFIRFFNDPALLFAREWSVTACAGFFAGYVVLGAALRNLLRPTSFWPALAWAVVVSLLARIIFRGQQFDPNEPLGLLLALPVIWQVARDAEHRAYLRAAAWTMVGLVVFTLAPFDFSALEPAFQRNAALDVIRRTAGIEPGLVELVFLYGGLVWLLCEAGVAPARLALWMPLAAVIVEFAQAWQPGRAAQLAGPVIMLASALLIWMTSRPAESGALVRSTRPR